MFVHIYIYEIYLNNTYFTVSFTNFSEMWSLEVKLLSKRTLRLTMILLSQKGVTDFW